MKPTKNDVKKINEYIWEIPKSFWSRMRVPARIYASENLLSGIWEDRSLEQLVNTAALPGVQKYVFAMPDVHEGYGCPIGGVLATKLPEGVISPGAIGYDINCGVRLLVSDIKSSEIKKNIIRLVELLFKNIPSGVGQGGKIKLDGKSMDKVLAKGAGYVVAKGYGYQEDIVVSEEGGCLCQANPDKVSPKAKRRGIDQLGTLGSGNHFLEVQKVEKIFDDSIAKRWGIFEDQVTFTIHTGSRGLGHQNCTDYVLMMQTALLKYKITIPDKELACAPFSSPEGQDYFASMAASANFAWANRQVLAYLVRKCWSQFTGEKIGPRPLRQIYDVAHNIAKIEEHIIDGKKIKVCVHRKGATCSFPGQPVIIPGSMGTASYLMIGQDKAMQETFGTVCHGGGRVMSRGEAKRQVKGEDIEVELYKQGIIARSHSYSGLSEEAPFAYKNIDEVVEVIHNVGLAKKIARLVPLGVIKG